MIASYQFFFRWGITVLLVTRIIWFFDQFVGLMLQVEPICPTVALHILMTGANTGVFGSIHIILDWL